MADNNVSSWAKPLIFVSKYFIASISDSVIYSGKISLIFVSSYFPLNIGLILPRLLLDLLFIKSLNNWVGIFPFPIS